MGTLHLVRHGQTISNVMGRLDTRLPGAGLTDFGARQAVRFALERPDATPAALFSSQALRAQQTAGLIGSVWQLPVTTVPDLHEVQVGDLEDAHDPESVRAFRDLVNTWYTGDSAIAFAGGESLDDLLSRYVPIIESLRMAHLDDPDSADIYVVSHGAAIRLAAAHLAEVDRDFAMANGLPNTGSIELAWRDGAWECVNWGGQVPAAKGRATAVDPMG
ncbi:histidine phosphatase family protein [Williamsia sp. CHRR-6]|uniref:histidine phosphatase family protein n=1 Tax=Williamsia sp. CHRR-6 TaxID=2835871 RepID=UPI001BDA7E39|nr:histidine phosphatase family protein [Williamsia sp. CHRR-6]MBT0567621.1 histidine phosphatase family protein [Williamsia sp. CHRR-6]